MKKHLISGLAAIAVATLTPLVAHAYTDYTGQVVQVSWYANGTDGEGFVKVDGLVEYRETPGSPVLCSNANLWIDGGRPGYENLIRLATAAQLSGRDIMARTDGCHAGYPTLSAVILQ